MAKLMQLPPQRHKRITRLKLLMRQRVTSKRITKDGIPFVYAKQRGKEIQTYRSMNKNLLALPLIAVGSQGSGKTNFMKLITYENYRKGISNLVIDILEDARFQNSVEKLFLMKIE